MHFKLKYVLQKLPYFLREIKKHIKKITNFKINILVEKNEI